MKRILIATLAMTLLALSAHATVPRTMNIQGVMTDDAGLPLPDGSYLVQFQIWDAATGGSDLWGETLLVDQVGGVFNAVLGHGEDFDPQIFGRTLWLSMTLDGESPAEPRIELTSVATALRAGSVDPGAAVRTLNGMTDNVILQGGTNVTVTQVDSTLVIDAAGGGGGDDGDWILDGDDVYHDTGKVYVGLNPLSKNRRGIPPLRGEDGADKDPSVVKMAVLGDDGGFYASIQDTNSLEDGRSAIFARRYSDGRRNDGVGYGVNDVNTAITGYNDWGDSYTFGVAGFSWFDFNNTGGVLGARNSGSVWAALAYRDSSAAHWGVYTPLNMHAGGMVETGTLRVKGGATPGYVLTSDAAGNATWQAPGASGTDDDGGISGTSLTHSASGAVAIGTAYPHNLEESTSKTTMQVSALFNPALALDAIYGGLTRWALYQSSGGLRFSKSSDYASAGTTAMSLAAGKLEVHDFGGTARIRLQSDDSMESGSRLDLYGSNSSSTAMISLDTQASTSNVGGRIDLRDGAGQTEVTLTANHDNTGVGRVTTPVLEITGGSDLSEQFDIGYGSMPTEPGMVVSIDPESPGRLTLSGEAYDRRVAGVISGAGGVNTGMVMGQRGTVADGELPVALVGRVYVWADATVGPIEPGDLLTTSDRPGHAMKVVDHDQAAGAILGKAMTGLKEGRGLILTLVSLQ